MFRSQNNNKDNEDDEFSSLSRSSSKLASIFNDDSPAKLPKDLKYVAPKPPATKGSTNVESQQNESNKSDISSAILYIAAAELYSHKKGVTSSEGRVMCCILRKKEEANLFILLLYRTKKNVIAQAKVCSKFNPVVQKNNYVSFIDNVNAQWSLYIDGIKYQEFLTQVGICRSLSAFAGPNPPSILVQSLCEGEKEGGEGLQSGDTAVITLCSWEVHNYKRGKQIGEVHKGLEVEVYVSETTSWKTGLLNRIHGDHCLVFVPNVQVYESDKSSVMVYEAMVESIKVEGKSSPASLSGDSSMTPKEEPHSSPPAAPSKETLVSRMARVGAQPILPLPPPRRTHTPHSTPAPPPNDSESEEDQRQRRAPSTGARSSTPSSLENNRTHDGQVPSGVSEGGPHSTASGGTPLGSCSVTQGPGAVITQHPFAQFPHEHKQPQQSEAPKTLDPILSLLFSEGRSQHTDLRLALSRLDFKIDSLLGKVTSLEERPLVPPGTSPTPSNREFLTQIEAHQSRVENSQQQIEGLTRALEDILAMNRELVEKAVACQRQRDVSLKAELDSSHECSKQQLKDEWSSSLESKELRVKQLEEEVALAQQERIRLEGCLAYEENFRRKLEEEVAQHQEETRKDPVKKEASYSWMAGADGPHSGAPTRAQTEAVVKQVMNATYRRAKASIRPNAVYEGSAVLQTILAAIRETTLLFLARRKEMEGGECGGGCPPPTSFGAEEHPTPQSQPPSPQRPTSVSSDPGRYDLRPGLPGGDVKTPNPTQDILLPSGYPKGPSPPSVPTQFSFRRTVSPTDLRLQEDNSEDEEDWKPLPPPPPLFSDTDDDDDWLS